MADYDVIVIGAGNGGLTAATTLARSGVRTLLLEKHNIPGGCATSFRRGRFEFEVALHQLSGVGTEGYPGPLRGVFEELGVLKDLELVEMENLYRIIYPGKMDLTLKADRAAASATLKEQFPEESEKIDRFFAFLYQYCEQWVCVAMLKDPEASPEKYPLYFTYCLKPTQDVFDEYGFSPLLQTAIDIYWSYMGLPPKTLPFCQFALVFWVYVDFKPWHLKGGSQMLSDTLLNAYLQAGGEVRFNCGARRIDVDHHVVKGVETETGEYYATTKVISNIGTLPTYVDLIDAEQVPDARFKELGARHVGVSAFTIFMGFDREPQELGIHETTNFIISDSDSNHAFERTGTLEPPQFTLFSCYDVDDPTFSPAGSCQAAFLTLAYGDPWQKISPHQYHQQKYQYAQSMLEMLYKVFPKCRDHVEEIEVATPLTHQRYLGHPGGSIYGYDPYAKDLEMFLENRSPIEGLYHCGASAVGGGFQPTLMSGNSIAKTVIRSLR